MAMLINDNDTLKKYVPNTLKAVAGELVNSIRLAKGNVFAEWKNSDTAKLFEDHGYKNKKECGGYFF